LLDVPYYLPEKLSKKYYLKTTEHDNQRDIMLVDGFPKVVKGALQGSLSGNEISLVIVKNALLVRRK
jgi:hypothetical protein